MTKPILILDNQYLASNPRPLRVVAGTFSLILLLLLAHTARAAPRFMKVRVTFYSPSNRARTATGRSARLPGLAVDPRIIPLGSRVFVPGFGVRVADDTGGAIKGRRIDVRLPHGRRKQARKHGVKHLRVRIVHPAKAKNTTPRKHTQRELLAKRKKALAQKRLLARRRHAARTR